MPTWQPGDPPTDTDHVDTNAGNSTDVSARQPQHPTEWTTGLGTVSTTVFVIRPESFNPAV
jgi:hypothetical protein